MDGNKTYTPEPWQRFGCIIVRREDFAILADCRRKYAKGSEFDTYEPNTDIDLDELEANARLMAAAPDMLKALVAVTSVLDILEHQESNLQASDYVYELVTSAIAKATGEEI